MGNVAVGSVARLCDNSPKYLRDQWPTPHGTMCTLKCAPCCPCESFLQTYFYLPGLTG